VIFNHGQYLIVRVIDDGIHAYNLMDFYHPFELDCYASTDFPYNYFFLDRRGQGLYNGINSTTDNNSSIISTTFLFKGWHFLEASGKILKNESMGRYLLLKREVGSKVEPLAIDYLNGKIFTNKLH
jgi:hypothetical protein